MTETGRKSVGVLNSSGASVAGFVVYGTLTGPASYSTGGFTTTLSGLTTVQSVVLQRTNAGLLTDSFVATVSGATFTVVAYVNATGLEVAALTNLSSVSFLYIAVGT